VHHWDFWCDCGDKLPFFVALSAIFMREATACGSSQERSVRFAKAEVMLARTLCSASICYLNHPFPAAERLFGWIKL
jgi:hypothetical protein